MEGRFMVTATYDRTARRHAPENDFGNDSLPSKSDFATCRLQKIRVTPFVLGEAEPRVELGMGQLLDPSRNRNIVATGVFCAEYCAIHPDWDWELL
jgi:hypothetical protein